MLHLSAYGTKFFIILFKRAVKVMKSGVYFIVIALLVAELLKILIYANQITCDVTKGTQSGLKSQKKNISHALFLCRSETLYSRYTHHKVP